MTVATERFETSRFTVLTVAEMISFNSTPEMVSAVPVGERLALVRQAGKFSGEIR